LKQTKPFWQTKTLKEMSTPEWESLCDGCARCCLEKLEDEDTGKVYYTNIACKLLDCEACRCSDYENRMKRVRDCVKITPDEQFFWMPKTCAYRRLAEGKDLEWWHPLVSGDPNTVHEAGISVRGRIGGTEGKVRVRDYQDYLVRWPMLDPSGSSKKKKLEPTGSSKQKKQEPKPVKKRKRTRSS
jgi:uncharacterized cysteine cluster protein YcgN (CxxCxxCC family)